MTSPLTHSGARRVLLAMSLVAFAAPAHAQTSGGGGSLTTFVNNIANILTGTLGQGMSILGIAIIFSAAWIVSQITGSGVGSSGF